MKIMTKKGFIECEIKKKKVVGNFTIHKKIERSKECKDELYTITHTKSGYSVFKRCFTNEKKAIELAKKLNDYPIFSEEELTDKSFTYEQKEQLIELIKKYL